MATAIIVGLATLANAVGEIRATDFNLVYTAVIIGVVYDIVNSVARWR